MNLDAQILAWMGSPGTALTVLVMLMLAASGLGMAVLEAFRIKERSIPIGLPGFVVGLDLLALLFRLTDGWIIAMPPAVLTGVLLPVALYGAIRLAPRLSGGIVRHPVLAGTVAAGALLTLGSALLVPYAWDEQVYQIALPLRYLTEGTTAMRLDNSYSGFPALPHFLMLPGIKLGGLAFPRLLVWATYPVLFLWLYLALRRFGRPAAAILTLAVLLAPVTVAMNRNSYMESFIALNLLAGVSLLGLTRRRALTAALFAGFTAAMAAAVKVTGGGAALAVGILWLFAFFSGRRDWRAWGVFALTALAVLLPFHWRAFAATGNFFYPFGASLLAPGSAAALVEHYQTQLGSYRYGVTGPLAIPFGWIFAAVDGKLFDGITFGWQFLAFAGVAAAGLIAVRRRHPARIGALLPGMCAVTAFYLFWIVTSQQTRFLFPLYFAAAWGAGFGLSRLPVPGRRFALLLIALAALVSVPLPMLRHYPIAWKLRSLAARSPREFLGHAGRDPEYFAVLDFLAAETAPGSRVMLLFERRNLYLPRPVLIGTPHFQQRNFTPVPETAAEVLAALRREKIDFVLLGTGNRDPDPLPEFDGENEKLLLLFAELLRTGVLELVDVPGGNGHMLLKVK